MKIRLFSTKIIFLTVLAGLLPTLIISLIAINMFINTMLSTIGVNLQDMAEMVGNNIDTYFDQREDDAKVISQANVLESDDSLVQKSYFDDVIDANDSILDIMVVGADGVVFSTAGEQSEIGQNLGQVEPGLVELFDQALEGEQGDVFFEKAHLDESGQLSMSMLTPITDDTNTIVISLLALEINMLPVEDMMASFDDHIIGDESVYLLNDDGEVMVTGDDEQELFTIFNDLTVKSDVLEATDVDGAKGYLIYNNIRGTEVMAGMADMRAHGKNEALDWGIIGVAETSAIAAQAYVLRNMIIIIAVILMVVIVIVSWIIARAIIRPLTTAVEVTNRVATGDLTVTIEKVTHDEIGEMQNALKEMTAKLLNIIQEIRNSADNVVSGSTQMNASSQQLAAGASEQASSSEEASASMEQMNASIQQNAQNAKETATISQKAASDADESGKAVNGAMEAMKKIADKISIIEEIARQTNLLALNAAIEAARAGEAGKGFAVVASEVRKLAERSQQAAGEISELSTSTVDVAEKAGQMLATLVPGIQKTAHLVEEISAASDEQNQGTEQVNSALLQLDKVIQQNASAAEEMASTSEVLSGQADHLQSVLQFFKTGDTGQSSRVGLETSRSAANEYKPLPEAKAQPVPESKGIKLIEEESVSDSDFADF